MSDSQSIEEDCLRGNLSKIIYLYYINTREISGELLRVHIISSHVNITCYFTRGNNMLFSQVL